MAEDIKEKAKYDWPALKAEFFASDVLEAKAFIRQRLGIETDENGNVARQIIGWSEEKRKMKEDIVKKAEIEMMEKLKISLEELMLNKKLLFSIDSKCLELVGKMAFHPGVSLTQNEEEFLRRYNSMTGRLREIWVRIQVELGLPINVEKLGVLANQQEMGKLIVEIVNPKNNNEIRNEAINSEN